MKYKHNETGRKILSVFDNFLSKWIVYFI